MHVTAELNFYLIGPILIGFLVHACLIGSAVSVTHAWLYNIDIAVYITRTAVNIVGIANSLSVFMFVPKLVDYSLPLNYAITT